MFNYFKNKAKKSESILVSKTLAPKQFGYVFEVPLSETDKIFGGSLLPIDELRKANTNQVFLVAIYNIDELASKITKYLENSTCDGSNGDKSSGQSPKP